ncbi:MAG TPA: hypothetical protein VI233_16240, partial [Puia sp.]
MKLSHGNSSLFGARGLILLPGLFTIVCGLIAVLIPIAFRSGGSYYTALFSPLGVSVYGMGILSTNRYLMTCFYLLLLVGCILFVVNRKEVRLIRFVAAVLLFDRF